MSVETFRIHEAPFHKTEWAYLAECSTEVMRPVADLRAVCSTLGIKVVKRVVGIEGVNRTFRDVRVVEIVDFGALERSAAWRELVSAALAVASQGVLF